MKTPPDGKGARVRPFFQVLLGATVLGVLTAAWMNIIGRMQGEEATLSEHLLYVMPFWYLWALFTPPVVWLAKHSPIGRGALVSRSALHLCFATVLSFSNTALRVGSEALLMGGVESYAGQEGMSSLTFWIALGTLELPIHLFIYSAILGVTYLVGYQRRLRERELATTQLSAQLAHAQVQALRMQINPHFLFNAMNSISMLVRDKRPEEAVKTIAGLSDLLRYVLDDASGQEVTLRRELDFIQRYLAIERVRFQDRLEVSIEASPDTLDSLVPNLLLQPLVENAIRHGISRSASATTIAITAQARGGAMELLVQDDGPGLEQQSTSRSGTGLGIANTRKRLRQLYGDQQSLELEDVAPHGAAVRITLPMHIEPVMNEDEHE